MKNIDFFSEKNDIIYDIKYIKMSANNNSYDCRQNIPDGSFNENDNCCEQDQTTATNFKQWQLPIYSKFRAKPHEMSIYIPVVDTALHYVHEFSDKYGERLHHAKEAIPKGEGQRDKSVPILNKTTYKYLNKSRNDDNNGSVSVFQRVWGFINIINDYRHYRDANITIKYIRECDMNMELMQQDLADKSKKMLLESDRNYWDVRHVMYLSKHTVNNHRKYYRNNGINKVLIALSLISMKTVGGMWPNIAFLFACGLFIANQLTYFGKLNLNKLYGLSIDVLEILAKDYPQ